MSGRPQLLSKDGPCLLSGKLLPRRILDALGSGTSVLGRLLGIIMRLRSAVVLSCVLLNVTRAEHPLHGSCECVASETHPSPTEYGRKPIQKIQALVTGFLHY